MLTKVAELPQTANAARRTHAQYRNLDRIVAHNLDADLADGVDDNLLSSYGCRPSHTLALGQTLQSL